MWQSLGKWTKQFLPPSPITPLQLGTVSVMLGGSFLWNYGYTQPKFEYLYSFSDNYQQLVGPSWVIIGNWWGKISRVVRWILETYENMKGGPARRVFLSSSYIFSYLYLRIYIWYIKISKWYHFQFFPGISIRIDTNRGVGVPFFWKSWNAGWYQYQHGWWCEFFKFLPKYAK